MTGDNRLILHIGTHKTGTSSFQTSLGANRKALKKQGFEPIGVAGKRRLAKPFPPARYNLGQLAQSFLRPDVATNARLRAGLPKRGPGFGTRYRADALEKINRSGAGTVIVSAEAFCFLRAPGEAAKLRAFIDETGRRPEIVVTFRNIDDWRASWTNQIEKFPKAKALNEALPDDQRANGTWYFDPAAILDFWKPFGPVTQVDYDASKAADGNVIPALYRAMGVDPSGFRLDFARNKRVEIEEV